MVARLDRPTSVYLNGIRFFAALVVFIGHISGRRFTGGLFWQVGPFMDAAVMVFFVLSGFVIAYVTDTHERDLRSYAINRIARIYSVALPALILTFVLDHFGMWLRPDFYSQSWGFSHTNDWLQYIASFTFTHRIWSYEINPGSNLPYWSLGFEVWYYVIFGAFFFLRGAPRYIIGLFAAFIAGPMILQLFPVWMMGVAAYHINKTEICPRWAAVAIVTATILLLGILAGIDINGPFHIPATVPFRYLSGAIFALNIIAFRNLRLSADAGGWLEKPIDWLAGMTFSLYLFHLPVAQFLTTVMPWPPKSPLTAVAIFGGTFLIVALLAEITERRKKAWRSGVSKLFERIAGFEPLRTASSR